MWCRPGVALKAPVCGGGEAAARGCETALIYTTILGLHVSFHGVGISLSRSRGVDLLLEMSRGSSCIDATSHGNGTGMIDDGPEFDGLAPGRTSRVACLPGHSFAFAPEAASLRSLRLWNPGVEHLVTGWGWRWRW